MALVPSLHLAVSCVHSVPLTDMHQFHELHIMLPLSSTRKRAIHSYILESCAFCRLNGYATLTPLNMPTAATGCLMVLNSSSTVLMSAATCRAMTGTAQ